jgi:hypothetical protein
MATAICAQAEKADGTFCQAQGDLPTTRQPTGREGDRDDQSHPAWLGELFPDRAFESMLLEDPRLGRKEDSASSDAGQIAQRPGLETVE